MFIIKKRKQRDEDQYQKQDEGHQRHDPTKAVKEMRMGKRAKLWGRGKKQKERGTREWKKEAQQRSKITTITE